MDFEAFPKVPRWSKSLIVTEKIDGTNAQILIKTPEHDGYDFGAHAKHPQALTMLERPSGTYEIFAGSRSRWLAPDNDNYGFAKWVLANAEELIDGLGSGRHYGEWWGQKIQRGYGLDHKRFSLFNIIRWHVETWVAMKLIPWENAVMEAKSQSQIKRLHAQVPKPFVPPPKCCHVVPMIDIVPADDDCNTVNNIMYTLKKRGSYAAPGFMNPEGVVLYHTGSNQTYKKTFEHDKGKWST